MQLSVDNVISIIVHKKQEAVVGQINTRKRKKFWKTVKSSNQSFRHSAYVVDNKPLLEDFETQAGLIWWSMNTKLW